MQGHLQPEVQIRVKETTLVLLPSKLVWWPDQRALIFADSHFGKASTFRRSGVPVPAGTTATMLNRLSQAIHDRDAHRIIIVGDFIHSEVSADNDYERELEEWRTKHDPVRMLLIRGNHDRRSDDFYKSLNVEISLDVEAKVAQLTFCHYPDLAKADEYTVCAHLHPSVTLRDVIGTIRLPCFIAENNRLILPPFGDFTGHGRFELKPQAKAYAICEEALLSCEQSFVDLRQMH